MRKLCTVVSLLAIWVVYQPDGTPLKGEEFRQVFRFTQTDLSFGKVMDYDIVLLTEGHVLSELGRPTLAGREFRIAVPPGMIVRSLKAEALSSVELPGTFTILPAQRPARIGMDLSGVGFVPPDDSIYLSDKAFSPYLVKLTGQTDFAGQPMALVDICPLSYLPLEGKLKLSTVVSVVLECSQGYRCGDYLPDNLSENTRKEYQNILRDMVVNPEAVKMQTNVSGSRGAFVLPPNGPFDHVIITTSSLFTAFQGLSDWHTRKGVRDTIIDVDWIYSHYAGASNQERIRNFIIDANSTWGTIYVLLGGRREQIPFEYRTYYLWSSPSDQYYSDFDDDWINEVNVGRCNTSRRIDIAAFVNKLMKYEMDPPRTDYLRNAVLIGMDLDATTHTEILNDSIYDFLPSLITERVYDSYGGNHREAVLSALNAGQHLVNHSDHANFDFLGAGDFNHDWGIDCSDVMALTNTGKASVIFSMGCYANCMDTTRSMADCFVLSNPSAGGVAFTGNTRSGLYWIGYPTGLSLTLDFEWWRSLMIRDKYNLGEILADAKHHFAATQPVEQHCEWVLNCLGEPEMPVWTDDPDSFAVIYSANTPEGPSTFVVTVLDSTTHSAASEVQVCLWKRGEVYARGTTANDGTVSFQISPSVGIMYLTTTKHNYLPFLADVVVTETNYAPVLTSISPKTLYEGEHLSFVVAATDANGSIPSLSAENLPLLATFQDNGAGTGTFDFIPGFEQAGNYSFLIVASDGLLADSVQIDITVENLDCGDANISGMVNISDAVYLISYIFAGGPPPNPILVGDANCDGFVNISDAVYLISYIFAGGAAPCAVCK